MKVFVSAAAEARALSLPNLISGFEAEISDTAKEIRLLAKMPPAAFTAPKHKADAAVPDVYLVARPTGKIYQGLPWWEATL